MDGTISDLRGEFFFWVRRDSSPTAPRMRSRRDRFLGRPEDGVGRPRWGLPIASGSEEGRDGHRRPREEGDREVVVDDLSPEGEGKGIGEGRRRGADGADEEG